MDTNLTEEKTLMETTDLVEMVGSTRALVRRAPADVVLTPVMDVKLAKSRLDELQAFCANYLQESTDGGLDGGDYGIIPGGGKKKVLFKSGAEKLCDVYGLADRYRILTKVEDFDHGLFDYTIECVLVRKTDEMFVGSGLGACSSYESKYRWREAKRTCPNCGVEAIIKGKAEYGGGWICWNKKGGCNAKFAEKDPAIINQVGGRIENPDIIDTKNTVLKMAKKRAKIDAVIGVTRSSGIFTQDLAEHEDEDEAIPVVGERGSVGPAPTAAKPVTTVVKPATATVPAATAVEPPPDETHAEKIARIKAEAARRTQTAHTPAGATTAPSAGTDVGTPEPPTAATVPPVTTVPAASTVQPTLPDPPAGQVYITAINVRNGPTVLKGGVAKPSWGPLYVVAFSKKVGVADSDQFVTDATTFDVALAGKAEDARDERRPVTVTVVPGTRKGSFTLTQIE